MREERSRQIQRDVIDNVLLPRKASLRLPALTNIGLQHLDRVERIDVVVHQPVDRVDLRVIERRSGERESVRGVDERLLQRDIAQRLIGRVVIQSIEQRKINKPITGMRDKIITTKNDFVMNPIEVEQV